MMTAWQLAVAKLTVNGGTLTVDDGTLAVGGGTLMSNSQHRLGNAIACMTW
jgi:hypothetical protein